MTAVVSLGTCLETPAVLAQETPTPRDLLPSGQPDVGLRERERRTLPGDGPTIEIPKSSPTRPPAGSDQIRFVLTDLRIEGATAYAPGQLRSEYAKFLDTEVSLTDLYGIAEAIQNRYRNDGFFLTRVIVPEQRARGGVFTLTIIEGFVSEVELSGIEHPSNGLVRRYLNQVRNERPLRLSTLEHYLLLANDIPGLTVSVLLRRAPDQIGAAILAVKVEVDKTSGFLSVDNLGSRFTGLLTTAGNVSSQGRTSFGERVSVTGVVRDAIWDDEWPGEWVLQGAGSMLIGGQGTEVGAVVSYGRSTPDNLGALVEDFEGSAVLFSVRVTHPFKRARDLSISGTVALDVISSSSDFVAIVPDTINDQLRVLSVSGRVDWLDRYAGRGFARAEVRQGLPFLGATSSGSTGASRANSSESFTTINAQASRLQRVTNTISVLTEVEGQHAFENVLSPEEFTLGARRYGRGYGQAEFVGDHGIGASVELQYSRVSEAFNVLEGYQAFTFLDYGKVWDRDNTAPTTAVTGERSSIEYKSVGGGVRVATQQDVTLELLVAKPLKTETRRQDNAGSKDVQVLFEVGGRF